MKDRPVPSFATIPGLTSLIFPTYNPGPEIRRTWDEVKQFVRTSRAAWEVLFVCDGSNDGTSEQLMLLANRDGLRCRVVVSPKNYGKGHAVRSGLQEARGEYRIFTDVDLSYGLDGVERVAEELWRGEPAVTGSRLMPGASFVIPAPLQDYAYKRRIQSAVYSALVRLLLPLNLTDTQAGLKGFHAGVVERLLPLLCCDGFSFDCELLLACQTLGYSIREIPVQFIYRDQTTTNFRKTLQMINDLWRIRKRFRDISIDDGMSAKPELHAKAA